MSKNAILFLITVSFFVSCETWRSECGGEITILNVIPDTTLTLNGESFTRDLYKEPAIVRHTEQKNIIIDHILPDETVVSATLERSKITDQLDVIKIIPERIGSTNVEVRLTDGCGKKEFSFKVSVVE